MLFTACLQFASFSRSYGGWGGYPPNVAGLGKKLSQAPVASVRSCKNGASYGLWSSCSAICKQFAYYLRSAMYITLYTKFWLFRTIPAQLRERVKRNRLGWVACLPITIREVIYVSINQLVVMYFTYV